MKNWRDWLRDRWPHWWPHPNPNTKMVPVPKIDDYETLVVYVLTGKALLADAKDKPALAEQIADTARSAARGAARKRLGLV